MRPLREDTLLPMGRSSSWVADIHAAKDAEVAQGQRLIVILKHLKSYLKPRFDARGGIR